KDGHVITIAPISWTYHEAPVDCWRIYPEGMKALYEEAGLKVDLCKFESLETYHHRMIIPGVGAMKNESGNFKSLIKNIIGWPLTCSFDTIAIGTKTG
ncbi:MAG: hypothetical protein KKF93_05375, partial [Candidatus Omnitrophica bacterium]|nr:hypothetical protein [Candidatus Omnitrophota bacterium]